ncbi:uncharacterized protein UHOD_12304 [Ustilago sp. UG-2017b]|nr:uncharacterized protein UHOD_12304 [Ustilago sp. UG-2017b]
MTPRSGVSVDGDEIDGVGDKVDHGLLQIHMRRRTGSISEVSQAQPRRGPSSRSMQTVTTQGLERQESKEPSPVEGGGAVYRRPASRSRGGGAVSKEATQLRRTGVALEGPPVQYSTKRVLSGERAGAVLLATL